MNRLFTPNTRRWISVICALTVIAAVLTYAPPAGACTYVTSTSFEEVKRSFSVAVQFEGRLLPGATVTVSSFGSLQLVATATTAPDGTAEFRNLAAGKYYVEVKHLGLAGFYQVEIRARAGTQAKARLDYNWGERPFEVDRAAGTIMDVPFAVAATLVAAANTRVTPVARVRVEFRHPTNGGAYTTFTNETGEFAIAGVPEGTYAMHIGIGTPPADSADFLVRIAPGAKRASLHIVRGDLCGGPVVQLWD